MEFFSLNSERKKAKKDKTAEWKEKVAEMEQQLVDLKNEQIVYQKSMEEKLADLEKTLKVQSKNIQASEQNQLYQKRFYFKASNGKIVSSEFYSIVPMRCDRHVALAHEFFIMEQFGHSKIALKSMGKYVSSENGKSKMYCNRDLPNMWEIFELIHHDGNAFSLKGNNGMYVSNRDGHLYCNAVEIGENEIFHSFFDI